MLCDKLFLWLFQLNPDRILSLVEGLSAYAAGHTFSAPAVKDREYRLEGLFLPPANRPDLPALILEAQHQRLASSGDHPVMSTLCRGSEACG